MLEQVPFIDREDELALIDKLIREWGTLYFLCINAPGGIGKTRLLQEIHKRYTSSDQTRLIVTDIIDFDDRVFHLPENVGRKIAQLLDEQIFEPYLRILLDYRKMEMIGISAESLSQASLEVDRIFVECFNKISNERRVALLLDTTDALEGTDFWNYLEKMGTQLKNTVLFVAGRNAGEVGNSLKSKLDTDVIEIIGLPPLLEKAGEEYLKQKQALLHFELETELAQKLLLLSGGSPILIDLAVEWRTRGISLDWLVGNSLEELLSLSDNEMKERKQEFERHLVSHIAQTRTQVDNLLLLMSHVYPLDMKMLAVFLDMDEDEATKLFEEAITYVFVKRLPDGRIVLHDEMRRIINTYIWPEVDPEKVRYRHDSQLAAEHLENSIKVIAQQIAQLEQEEKNAAQKDDAESELRAFTEREALEREMWILKEQHLRHTLFVDINKGVQTFTNAFDEATRTCQFSYRGPLLVQMQEHVDEFSQEQRCEIESRRVKFLLDKGEYSEAKELVTETLESFDVKSEQQVNMLILRANAGIRLGDVKEGISDFEKAVKISESNKLPIWRIKSLNGLGYAYRLIGNVDCAQQYYQQARRLCFEQGGLEREELRIDYGWISNNLAFALSNDNRTIRTAIDIARSAIQHWEFIGNDIGLGAGYLVLGITFYRNDLHEPALEAYQKALNIFEPLKHRDWLGQIYSWRGVLHYIMLKPEEAKKDLEKSLEIGSSNIEAMTLNRLGRVYMYLKEWDLAEEYMKKSIERAKQIPDYGYWLASIARLAAIASEKRESYRLDEFMQMLDNACKEIETPEKNALGTAHISLAKLAMGQNDTSKVENIISFLQQGITLVIENGPSVSTDVLKRLSVVEKIFNLINPVIIRSVGKALQNYISYKEIETLDYSALTPMMYKWANWK